jgi:hypothetical protein
MALLGAVIGGVAASFLAVKLKQPVMLAIVITIAAVVGYTLIPW